MEQYKEAKRVSKQWDKSNPKSAITSWKQEMILHLQKESRKNHYKDGYHGDLGDVDYFYCYQLKLAEKYYDLVKGT